MTLYLSYNRLSEIPNFTTLPKLKFIEAYYNLLKELPDFANLPSLKWVLYTTTTNQDLRFYYPNKLNKG
jgi:Leucine-rich repeat (LRR) protein